MSRELPFIVMQEKKTGFLVTLTTLALLPPGCDIRQTNAFCSSSLSLNSQKHDGSKAACLFFLQETRLSFTDVNKGCSDLSMATALGCGLSSLPTLHTRSAHREDYLPTLAGLVGPKAGVPILLVFFQTECPSTSAHTLECRNAGVSS